MLRVKNGAVVDCLGVFGELADGLDRPERNARPVHARQQFLRGPATDDIAHGIQPGRHVGDALANISTTLPLQQFLAVEGFAESRKVIVLQGHTDGVTVCGLPGAQQCQRHRVRHVIGHETVDTDHIGQGVGGVGIDHGHVHTLPPAGAVGAVAGIEGCQGRTGGSGRRGLVDDGGLDQLRLVTEGFAL